MDESHVSASDGAIPYHSARSDGPPAEPVKASHAWRRHGAGPATGRSRALQVEQREAEWEPLRLPHPWRQQPLTNASEVRHGQSRGRPVRLRVHSRDSC